MAPSKRNKKKIRRQGIISHFTKTQVLPKLTMFLHFFKQAQLSFSII